MERTTSALYNLSNINECIEFIEIYLEKLKQNKYIVICYKTDSELYDVFVKNIVEILSIYINDLAIETQYFTEPVKKPTLIFIDSIIENLESDNVAIIHNNNIHKLKKTCMHSNFGLNNELTKELKNKIFSMAQIRNTHDQDKFRSELLNIYDGKCVVTKTNIKQILDAAHIIPYCISKNFSPGNGLLLRKDIHKLYDAKLLDINPETCKLELSDEISSDPCYAKYNNVTLNFPEKYKNDIINNIKYKYNINK